jgi:hypothetical protein
VVKVGATLRTGDEEPAGYMRFDTSKIYGGAGNRAYFLRYNVSDLPLQCAHLTIDSPYLKPIIKEGKIHLLPGYHLIYKLLFSFVN